ncbi:MAG TPA: iron-sulfur cluster assembly protein [Ktedonobacterales bacterium]
MERATDTTDTTDTTTVADANTTTDTPDMTAEIFEALKNVYDPELGVNIVDLGLVYGVDIREDGYCTLTMTLTTPGCPMHESIGEGVGAALSTVEGVTGGEIKIVWEPRWEPSMMTDAGRSELGYW